MMLILYRLFLLTLVGGPLMAIYLMINHREGLDHQLVEMPDWVPFWPLMTIPYLLMLVVPGCLACILREQRHFHQYLASLFLGILIIGSIWYFYPTEMTRPPTPEGWQYQIHRDLVAIDNPVNIVPCGHVVGPIAIIFLLAQERPNWLLWLLLLLGFGILSVITTWQHRPVDVLTGSLISLAIMFLTNWLFRNAPQG